MAKAIDLTGMVFSAGFRHSDGVEPVVKNVYVGKGDGRWEPKEVEITIVEYSELVDDLPVAYRDGGFCWFDVDAQIAAAREVEETQDAFLAATGRM